ncbi:abscisic acid 8'-hydroxylase 1-like isoform X2 [Sesamum indicum]|uniref:Abscisic acid 8'-hydroxylase 1-like isoform X2 n=1 Tax=Sesamum indicum TaxID=4182 RepID=A0A8M8V929_SESIN|nr:abscisic acid 8'-hydroxylase 1-like isoform X2 [Sesamum indicum]
MELIIFFFLALAASLVLLSSLFLLKFLSFAKPKLPLPPGTMGWPYIGETFQLYSQNPNTFFSSKVKKYGSIFKTHILGCPCVMTSSPEAAKLVLVSKAHLFKPTFPASKERMLGKQAIFFHQGDYHAKLRKLVLRAFMPESIKNIVSDIESLAVGSLESWEGKLITTFQEMKTYAFNVALLSIFGKDEVLYREDLKRCYYILEKGYNSMPINLPGTLFNKAMKARKELAQILAKILSLRRQMKKNQTDLLGSFMGDVEGLTDEQIADNIIGVIFAARDTTASVLTWILKYLAENPTVLKAVTEEQESIMKSKVEEGLKWEDTKKMPITTRVIQETLRVASVLSFTFREAVEDVEFNGYLIPKGWKVLPLFRNIHHSPDNFPDPEKFDPSRLLQSPIHSCHSGTGRIHVQGMSWRSWRSWFFYTI